MRHAYITEHFPNLSGSFLLIFFFVSRTVYEIRTLTLQFVAMWRLLCYSRHHILDNSSHRSEVNEGGQDFTVYPVYGRILRVEK